MIAEVRNLPFFPDGRGWVMVGPAAGAYVYATMCKPGVVKGWHMHPKHTDRLMCVSGVAHVAVAREQVSVWDRMPNGRWDVESHIIGALNPKLLVIPPRVWHAFTPADAEPCVIVNAPDLPYDANDQEHRDEVPFEW